MVQDTSKICEVATFDTNNKHHVVFFRSDLTTQNISFEKILKLNAEIILYICFLLWFTWDYI